MERGGPLATNSVARARVAVFLLAGALASLAVTSLIHSNGPAAAQTGLGGSPAACPSVQPDAQDAGSFAFGHLEFDWNPAAPEGVPGFDSWPPGTRRR